MRTSHYRPSALYTQDDIIVTSEQIYYNYRKSHEMASTGGAHGSAYGSEELDLTLNFNCECERTQILLDWIFADFDKYASASFLGPSKFLHLVSTAPSRFFISKVEESKVDILYSVHSHDRSETTAATS